jgi:hypothetical protein
LILHRRPGSPGFAALGRDLHDDIRRASIIRSEIGTNRKLMMDANQVWDVNQAIAWMRELEQFDPWWIEEPTSPDDVLGHAAIARSLEPIRVATGEHCQNRVMFKQLLQAKAIGVCQVDAALGKAFLTINNQGDSFSVLQLVDGDRAASGGPEHALVGGRGALPRRWYAAVWDDQYTAPRLELPFGGPDLYRSDDDAGTWTDVLASTTEVQARS